MPVMQRFVFNTGGVKPRREKLEGRDHLVVPAAMLGDDQIIEGSGGKILYPGEENSKNPTIWNAKPLVVYHPEMNGTYISARDPDVFNSRKVGLIFNTEHSESKLRTECWFDEERTKEVDYRVYEAVVNGRPMEVSTGLQMELDETGGELDGHKFAGTARNYQPDHLAVLPDKTGAFSISMGGGLFANQRKTIFAVNAKWTDEKKSTLTPADFGDPTHRGFPVSTQEDLEAAATMIHNAADPSAVKRRLCLIANEKGLKVPETWVNEMSASDIQCAVRDALAAKLGEPGKSWDGYIVDLFPDSKTVVYRVGWEYDAGLYQVTYKQAGDTVTLDGDPVKVVRTTDYKTVANQGGSTKGTKMAFDKTAHINKLIGNGWEEGDRTDLEAMSDKALQKIQPSVVVNQGIQTPPVSPPAPTPAVGKPLTTNEYINTLPPDVAKQVRRGLVADQKRKDTAITKLMANSANPFQKDFLETKDADELEGLVALSASASGDGDDTNGGMFRQGYFDASAGGVVGNYAGAAGSPIVGNAGAVTLEDPFEAPEIDFTK